MADEISNKSPAISSEVRGHEENIREDNQNNIDFYQHKSPLSSSRSLPPAEGKGEATKHERWMDRTAITHTPTFFINGKKLPGRYEIKDLDKMIPQLAETFMV